MNYYCMVLSSSFHEEPCVNKKKENNYSKTVHHIYLRIRIIRFEMMLLCNNESI